MAAPRLDPHPQSLGSPERASRTQSSMRGKASSELCPHMPIPSSRLGKGAGRGFADIKANQFRLGLNTDSKMPPESHYSLCICRLALQLGVLDRMSVCPLQDHRNISQSKAATLSPIQG